MLLRLFCLSAPESEESIYSKSIKGLVCRFKIIKVIFKGVNPVFRKFISVKINKCNSLVLDVITLLNKLFYYSYMYLLLMSHLIG